jgi:tol-pal system protein YbgF
MRRSLRLAAAAALLPVLAGCFATKRDVEDLRLEIQQSRQAQQRDIDQLIRRTSAMLDSLRDQNTRMRGDLANRLVAIERQLVQIGELSGQSQAQLADLRRQINERAEEARRAQEEASDTASDGGGTGGAADASQAQAVYDAALGAYRRSSMTTARAGFEEFLRVAPRHRLAADAQYYIGETYARDPDRAVEAFEAVVERYATSARAPTALLRIARIEEERGNRTEARARFNQIVRAYPRSPEATEARRALGTATRG